MLELLPRRLKNPRIWQAALVAYWLMLFVATHVPTETIPTAHRADKVAHFTAFAVLAALLVTTWQVAAGHLTSRHLFVAWLVVVAYGAVDEWLQIPVGRDCNIWDWTADAAGALFAIVLFALLRAIIAAGQR